MATVMIRVDKSVRNAAAALAAASGTTIADVVARAVKEAEHQAFWDAQNAALNRLTPEEMADYHAENEEWNATLKDGLDEW
ncbi:hypothetical protein AB0I28_38715 [Phytomonospora sp. NPDC050363]|uniref:hypothetical protein n=1 Tax=Phytomonospora sp. NPDC050363 TaxID=3155642 RepID=UPI0033E47509